MRTPDRFNQANLSSKSVLQKTGVTIDSVIQANPLSNMKLRRCLKAISRSPTYLGLMSVGQSRFDIQGNVSGEVTENEYQYILASRLSTKKPSSDLTPDEKRKINHARFNHRTAGIGEESPRLRLPVPCNRRR
ncbi:hypothetical protein ERD95_16020 [Enterobacteriaceae bacterium ML5]|nr:hypothetical protein ERD95_16020 [Enterobacteriaceae bacterium ML5]